MVIAVNDSTLRACNVRGCDKVAASDLDMCWDHAVNEQTHPSGHMLQAIAFTGEDPLAVLDAAAERLDRAQDAHSLMERLIAAAETTDAALTAILDDLGAQRETAARLVATLQELDDVPDDAVLAAEALSAQAKARHESARVIAAAYQTETIETVRHYTRHLRLSASEQLEAAERAYWQI